MFLNFLQFLGGLLFRKKIYNLIFCSDSIGNDEVTRWGDILFLWASKQEVRVKTWGLFC